MVSLSSFTTAPDRRSPVGPGRRCFFFLAAWASPLLSLCLHLSPAASRWAQFDRAAIESGELWRWVTGHWAHWNAEHFLLDAVVFGALATPCARRSPGRLIWALGLAALAIPISVFLVLPEMTYYRGLSGLDAALAALLCAQVLREARGSKELVSSWIATVILLALGAKILYELLTGDALFLDQTAAGFVPVPLAHGVGAAAGLLAGLSPPIAPPLPHPSGQKPPSPAAKSTLAAKQ